MLIRRRYPLAVLTLTALGFFTYHAAGFPAIGVAVPMAAALYSAAEAGRARAGAAAATLTLAVATLYRLLAGQDPALVLGYELVSHGALMVAVLALGHNVRTARRLRLRTRQVTRLLDRQGALDADARIRDDRMHLARELHDSIGHSLAVASLYTNVAREAEDAERRGHALELARSGISDSLAHLRRTVGLLRDPGRALDSGGPGLDDLPHLVAAPVAAGYDVELEVEDVRPGPAIEAVVFRIVQEGVTNALRHSSARRIRIAVREEPGGMVTVVVSDDGTPPRSAAGGAGHGHGLRGLGERVQEIGGSLDAGPTAGGWLVRAELPVGAEAR
jgi:signal transduction histidine kinase